MGECNSKRLKTYPPTTSDKLKEILEYPKLYLIDYFDTIKTQIDVDFEQKFKQIKDDFELRDQTTKEWTKQIDIVEACLAKCINNKLSDELVKDVKDKLENIESNRENETSEGVNGDNEINIESDSESETSEETNESNVESAKGNEDELDKIKSKLENHLLQNDSYAVIRVDVNVWRFVQSRKVVILEQGLNQLEIDCLRHILRNLCEQNDDEEYYDHEAINIVRLNHIASQIEESREDIIFIESFQNVTRLFFNFDFIKPNNAISLLQDSLKEFTNLTEINLNGIIEPPHCWKMQDDNYYDSKIEIHKDAFVGLVSLKKLVIENFTSVCLKDGCFNGLSNLEELLLDKDDIDKESFTGLVNLKTLNLIRNVEYTNSHSILIMAKSFSELNHLKSLTISTSKNDNYYSVEARIDGNAFFGLSNLETLDLTDCELPSLKKLYFRYLKNLKELKLSHCTITQLKENVFVSLIRLEKLDLNSNDNISFKRESFNGLSSLKHLNLSSCRLKSLRKDSFRRLANLEMIDLSCNFDIELEDGCFNGLTNLEELKLTYCKLNRLKEDIFSELVSLKKLNLESCGLISLKKDVFLRLNNLEVIDLNSNENIDLEDGCFNGLFQLKALDLSNCRIVTLKENLLIGLVCLELINLSENESFQLDFRAFNKANLKHLQLTFCKIKKLNKDLFIGFENLESLNLSFNRDIVFEQDCFNGLNKLKELNLSYCSIHDLKENVFLGLNGLETLHLHCYNEISFNLGCFNGLHNLEYLNLPQDNNKMFKHVKEDFSELKEIDLRNNSDCALLSSAKLVFLNSLNKLKWITFVNELLGGKAKSVWLNDNSIYGLKYINKFH